MNKGRIMADGQTREILGNRELLEANSLELPLRLQGFHSCLFAVHASQGIPECSPQMLDPASVDTKIREAKPRRGTDMDHSFFSTEPEFDIINKTEHRNKKSCPEILFLSFVHNASVFLDNTFQYSPGLFS